MILWLFSWPNAECSNFKQIFVITTQVVDFNHSFAKSFLQLFWPRWYARTYRGWGRGKRDQKRNIRRNLIKFLKKTLDRQVSWDTRLVSWAKTSLPVSFYSKQLEKNLGHRPVDSCLSHRMSQGRLGRCVEDFLKFVSFFFPEYKFSLRSCRSSSFFFFAGNLVGNLAGILQDFYDPQSKGSKISGKISECFS